MSSSVQEKLNKTAADPIFTPSEITDLLRFSIRNFLPVLIVGKPGQGKTTIIETVTDELGFDLIKTHPVTSDPTDYQGLPAVSGTGKNKQADFLPYGDLKRLIDSTNPTVHFADDLGPASKMVQAAYMQLVQGRAVGGHKIGDNVVFIGATNRKQDKAAVQSVIEPLKSKYFTVVELVSDLKDFSQWYNQQTGLAPTYDKDGNINGSEEKPLPHEVLSWVRYQPEVLDEWEATADMSLMPTPRGIEHVARMLLAEIPEKLQLRTFAGAIGKARATEFIQFLRIYQNLPDPDAVLMDPDAATIPKEPGYLYALCGALAARASQANIERLIQFANRLTEEFSVLLVRDAVQKDFDNLCTNLAFTKWVDKHQDVLI